MLKHTRCRAGLSGENKIDEKEEKGKCKKSRLHPFGWDKEQCFKCPEKEKPVLEAASVAENILN